MRQLKIRLEEGAPGLNIEFDETITNHMIISSLSNIGGATLENMTSVISSQRESTSEDMHNQFDYFVKATKSK